MNSELTSTTPENATPRTDAMLKAWRDARDQDPIGDVMGPVDLCRYLERELTATQAKIASLEQSVRDLTDKANYWREQSIQIKQERDELRGRLAPHTNEPNPQDAISTSDLEDAKYEAFEKFTKGLREPIQSDYERRLALAAWLGAITWSKCQTSVEDSLEVLRQAMLKDLDYAWTWHCNIAMACHDCGARPHEACNDGAARFLGLLFPRVDTTKHVGFPAKKETPLPSEPTAGGEKEEAQRIHDLLFPKLHDLREELRAWLDTQTITSENIGDIRRSCFMPFDSEWNGVVRDETAKREQDAPSPQPDLERVKAAFAAGKRVQFMFFRGSLWHDWLSSVAPDWYAAEFRIHPADDQPEPVSANKPWSLLAPPPGKEWHRADWTEDMLPEGWREAMNTEPNPDLPLVVDRPPDGHFHDYYSQPYYCGNCGMHQRRWILKGTRKPQSVVCDNCKCSTTKP